MRFPTFGDLGTGLMMMCAITVTALLVHREAQPVRPSEARAVRDVKEWRSFATGGHRRGPTNAPVTIVEFADFQCPYCRESARIIKAVLDSSQGRVAHIYRHYPLTNAHPFAMTAAVAAECAARQARFAELHDALFTAQDSIGKLPWSVFASRAGVPDTTKFSECVAHPAGVMPGVQADIAAAGKLSIAATPSVMVNGKLFRGAPTYEQLTKLVVDAQQQ